jgi:hypothetical protein
MMWKSDVWKSLWKDGRVMFCKTITVFGRPISGKYHDDYRPLGKPRRRWKDNIKMYLQDVG